MRMGAGLRVALHRIPGCGAAIISNDGKEFVSRIMSETTKVTAAASESAKHMLREKGRLMSASEIERTLVRLAHEIVERNDGAANLGLVGIKRRGVPLAERLARMIEGIEKRPVDTGVLDISFYRDDLTTAGPRPIVKPGDLGFDVNGRDIVLMDDVLYTGRTIRAALDALFDHGRPKSVQLLVLIDRGHRELPIQATFTGRMVPTSRREIIEVKLNEIDGQEQVLLVELVD
jgi:pyrimidine operon attenuation protein/uracil phosphoribosyltransferase